ncbi:MAG: ferritin family protein [Sedimentisphaerales bacterium]|nr:ferritin family protein [Sedimentisphaerales bacterium]
MKRFGSVSEILDFAIREEEEAAAFYYDLAHAVNKPWMREIFEDFAAEERGHKQKLLSVRLGQHPLPTPEDINDLQMADYLVDVEPSADMSYQDALILAMKKEKAAYKLYIDLAAVCQADELRGTLLGLAQQEANHKLRFEIEYDTLLKEG